MQTLLIILLVLFIITRLLRYLMPYILKRLQRKMEERMQNYTNNTNTRQTDTSSEGETVVVSKPNKATQSKTDEMGDYVDFEEVD